MHVTGEMKEIAFRFYSFVGGLCVAAVLSGCASTRPPSPEVGAAPQPGLGMAYMTEQGRTIEPFSHVVFCQTYPGECDAANRHQSVEWTPMRAAELQSVNRLVNDRITPKNDSRDDVWTLSPRSGDCEDYAVTKRHLLIRNGWPPSALRLAIGYTQRGEGHLVLAVRTGDGDVILDNETNTIRNWRDARLDWREIQSSGNPRVWHKV